MKPERTRVDIGATFGPLASMHAALDAANCGMPCGFLATLPSSTVREVESRLRLALLQFPVLRTRLLITEGRPVLERATQTPLAREAPLSFTASGSPNIWRCVLTQDGPDVQVQAIFAHAAADGGSMLRLVHLLAGGEPRSGASSTRSAAPPPVLSWTSRFLMEEMRPAFRLAPEAEAPVGVSWVRTSASDRDRFLAAAKSVCRGGAPLLGAASALAACALSGAERRPRISLNFPIARRDLAPVGGFGFGVGSILLRPRVDRTGPLEALARQLHEDLHQRVAAGWDLGLERFLGEDPRRHFRFAAIRNATPPDPTLNVSWKGMIETPAGPASSRNLVFFAAAPTGHVSAHADAEGLSISITAPRSPALRMALLEGVCSRLQVRPVTSGTYA